MEDLLTKHRSIITDFSMWNWAETMGLNILVLFQNFLMSWTFMQLPSISRLNYAVIVFINTDYNEIFCEIVYVNYRK